jgi:hypothetical protein
MSFSTELSFSIFPGNSDSDGFVLGFEFGAELLWQQRIKILANRVLFLIDGVEDGRGREKIQYKNLLVSTVNHVAK